MNPKALNQALLFIDSWLAFRHQYEDLPGFVVALSHKGKVVFQKAYGYANLESQEKLTPNHVFRIASHSKTFTATALMQLAEQGKLYLDDPVIKHLPWLKEHPDARFRQVTIRQVMSHGAGIIRDGLDSDFWQLNKPFPDDKLLKEAVLEANLVLENNTKMKYSNIGYGLLGYILEAVSGQTFHEYVLEHIIRPLNLKHTGPEYTSRTKEKLATGYTKAGPAKKRLPIRDTGTHALAAATGCYATAADLCTYFSAHMVGSSKLLSGESKKEMQRTAWKMQSWGTHEKAYGLGLQIENTKSRRLVGHGGGFPGHATQTYFDPADELAVVVLTNAIDGPATTMVTGIYEILDAYKKYYKAKPAHNLTAFRGRFINLWDVSDIAPIGNHIFVVNPDSWHPFAHYEELAYIDASTLKITKAPSLYSEGELVHFNFDKNRTPTSVRYAGSTMWPEKIWLAKLKHKKQIG